MLYGTKKDLAKELIRWKRKTAKTIYEHGNSSAYCSDFVVNFEQ